MQVTKIRRAITFKQEQWLQPYIDFNTAERAKATTDFEKDFYKLMNNAVFGKTMENLRNRIDIQFVTRNQSWASMQRKRLVRSKRSLPLHSTTVTLSTTSLSRQSR